MDVGAVDPHTWKVIYLGTVDDGACGLLRQWDRDRPVVVLTEEDDGRLEDAGEIHGLVPVALRGGTISEGGEDHLVTVPQAAPHGKPDGVGDLGRHRNGERGEVIFVWIPRSVRKPTEQR